jgi:hypothetical protein
MPSIRSAGVRAASRNQHDAATRSTVLEPAGELAERVLGSRSPQGAQQGSPKFADLIATAAEPQHRLNKAPSQESAIRLVNGWSIARTAHVQFSALK